MTQSPDEAPAWEAFADAGDADLAGRLAFLRECDALKTVLRRSRLTDGSRRENAGEHSWHVALMALVLAPYANGAVDVSRVVQMLLVHDLVEIDAGDTYCYDDAGNADKREREIAAADRLFALLPGLPGGELRALWDEFEAGTTAEAQFARAVDRLQPILLNVANGGKLWTDNAISAARIEEANRHVAAGSETLWKVIRKIIDHASAADWLAPPSDPL